MISIIKDFVTIPVKLSTSAWQKLVLDSITTKNNHKFDSKIYRDTTLETLNVIYHSKCAYCETDTSAGAPMQVEHYRPKARVTEDSTHQGYYWIAYEWSNLILSCSKCNNKKRNRFPILNNRVIEPSLGNDGLPTGEFSFANSLTFIAEQPQLLHPEIDVIEDHFLFQENGTIIARSKRAQKTIDICGLNRPELVFKRFTVCQEYRNDIKEILTDFLSGQITADQCRYSMKRVFKELTLLQKPEKQYSRFGYFLFHKFDLFIADSLEEKQKDAVRKLFELFKNGDL